MANIILKYSRIVVVAFIIFMISGSCRKFVEVSPPITSTVTDIVYGDDLQAISALNGIYTRLPQISIFTAGPGYLQTTSIYAGLSSDELTLFTLTHGYFPYYSNGLAGVTSNIHAWSVIYPYIYMANDAIENLTKATKLTVVVRNQLTGEALFLRALFYFYLVNLYGDIPLVVGTNYEVNRLIPRTPVKKVYDQIITDLKNAQGLLDEKFLDGNLQPYNGTAERLRPTKWTATALLARAFLFNGDFVNAELEATKVIDQTSLFSLLPLNNVFKANSNEAIWQMPSLRTGLQASTPEGRVFILPAGGPNSSFPYYLSNNIVNSFTAGDARGVLGNWINRVTVGGTHYYYPYKYKIGSVNQPVDEYSMILRLAEQYLIRAEARAEQNNLSGAISDLNIIRTRARALPTATVPNPLPNLSSILSKQQILDAVLQERKVELFTELGHRWLDLKRTGKVNEVMSVVTPQKGGVWNPNWQYYPIPESELQRNPNLIQNPGY